ncbi:ABC-type transport system involved in multi-copper enzyme maturation permease subunit [Pedobacter sp. UYP24]
MNTKLLMTASAALMGVLGIIFSFLPEEALLAFGQTPTATLILILQILGALYFGFAVMNWLAKTVLMGGIYAKPLSTGNFAHFGIAGIALIKGALNSGTTSIYIWALAIIYALFALLFGRVWVTSPKQVKG